MNTVANTPDVLVMISVLRYLRTKPYGVDLAEMAGQFGLTPSAMRLLIDQMWTTEVLDASGQPSPGAMIDFDAEGLEQDEPWVKLTNDPIGEIPVRFTPAELATVQLGLQALASVVSAEQAERVDSLVAKLKLGAIHRQQVVNDTKLAVLRDAIDAGRQLHLQYRSETAKTPTTRVVDPLRIAILEGVTYLNAYCHLRKQLRWFRSDRIINCVMGEQVTARYTEADRNRPLAVHGRSLPRVECRVNAKGLTLLQPYLQHRKRLPQLTGLDTTTVTFQVRSFDALAALVARAGGSVEVLKPATARDFVAAWCTDAIAHHAVD